MIKKALTFITVTILAASIVGSQPVLADTPSVLITEVQTGFIDSTGTEYPKQEFIEISNTSATKVNLDNWTLEYLSSASTGSGAPTSTLATLNGQIKPYGHVLINHSGYSPAPADLNFGTNDTSTSGLLAKTGGHVRLMNGTSMVDCVAWGSATNIAGCDKVSAVAAAGYSLQRVLAGITYDKSRGVTNLTPPNPQGGDLEAPYTPVGPVPTCDGVILSEILANPIGDDALGEFIEIYNPTDHNESLYGCSLQLSPTKQFAFTSADTILSHEYKAFPYSATGLQLSNTGSTVTLITMSQQSSVTYPSVGDDQSWSLIDGNWSMVSRPTPNSANLADLPVVATANAAAVDLIAELQPCPAGKYRNSNTGRCRNIATNAVLATCTVGQERNPITGRCRKVTKIVPTPCQSDQERNPATGRCKKVVTASTQKACEPGQERNAQTNRCRKASPSSSSKVLGATFSPAKAYHYWLVGVVIALILGYATYEYRHDIANRLRKRQTVS
jgi:hypothetical protein